MLLSFYLTVFLESCMLSSQNTETQEVEQAVQSQEELNQALVAAVNRGREEQTRQLLIQGARLDIKDNAGRVPLHYAAGATGQGRLNIVSILLEANADINVQDNIGWTPLHYAAQSRSKDIVEFLVKSGADIDVVNYRGETPFTWIKKKVFLYKAQGSTLPNPERMEEYEEIAKLLKRDIYYVAVSGKNNNPGTLRLPFASIDKAIEVAEPGDIVFIRDGVYSCPEPIYIDKSGERGNPISLRAYPEENVILDFSETMTYSIFITGSYWHLKDLTIRGSNCSSIFLYGEKACHNILEQLTVFSGNFAGIVARDNPAYNIFLNCDSCENFDPEMNGGNSDGFEIDCGLGEGNILIGDRAWNNSDDGFDLWYAVSMVRVERCYSVRNGVNNWNHPYFSGDGNGFKLGSGSGRHVLIDCVAWDNGRRGFDLNLNTTGVTLRNCIAFSNPINYRFNYSAGVSLTEEEREGPGLCAFSNNISYDGTGEDSFHDDAKIKNNSWDLALSLTDSDFLSLNDSMMTAPRNPDGSIPYNDFLRLAPGSAAIDAGTDVNMPYIGKAPDLGAFEYNPDENAENYVKMLHQYVRDHDIEKINEMLASGTDINEKDWLGYAPLHWACYFGCNDLVTLLIDKGADPNLLSDTGRTCLEIATAMDYGEIAELLKKHGATK